MILTYRDGAFVCVCKFEERSLPKEFGFRWDEATKKWYTKDHETAARLSAHADDKAKTKLSKNQSAIEPWTGGLITPPQNELFQFQVEAAHFALARKKSYLALDPGLGKTPIAAVVAATLYEREPFCFLYICPPFLVQNTINEFETWAPRLVTERFEADPFWNTVNVLPDTMLGKWGITNLVIACREKNVKTMLIVDEAHRFKNTTAQRTKYMFGGKIEGKWVKGITTLFDRVLYLSGTPMPNRPMELFPVLHNSVPELIDNMDWFQFGLKYCAAFETQFGWDFTGASNLDLLRSKIHGSFMLRMKKADVMKDLPAKTEEMILLDAEMPPKFAKLDAKILSSYSGEDLLAKDIASDLGLDEDEPLHLSTYRKELGLIKVGEVSKYIKYFLEETDESLLVFAIHTEVIETLTKKLKTYSPLVITGQTKMNERQAIVEAYQNEPDKRVFIGNIQAAGVGFTLTKATRVIFAEYSWVPGDNDQASDRVHRIGQKDNVLVQYLVFRGSVDEAVLKTVLEKRKATVKI